MEIARDFFYDEVRDGFYIPGIMKRAWGAELKILYEIDRICKKYDISYYVYAGTLLGAVRDGGFIPWDDDVDIMMLRDDFNKFCLAAEKELSKDLILNSFNTVDDYCSWIFSVGIRETNFRAETLRKFCEFPYYAVVDIFVLDELAKNAEEELDRRQILKMLLLMLDKIKNHKEKTKSFQKELKKVEEILKIRFNRTKELEGQFYEIIDRVFQAFNGEEGDVVSCLSCLINNEDITFPKSSLSETCFFSFCDLKVPVPGEYHSLLSSWFGDYNKKVKRGGDHVYPYYKNHEINLKNRFKVLESMEYSFSKEDLNRTDVQNFRDLAIQTVDSFISFQKLLFQDFISGNLSVCLSKLSSSQNDAISFGGAIEQKKGEGTESVALLEKYCEALYEVYQSLSNYILLEEQFKEIPEESEISSEKESYNSDDLLRIKKNLTGKMEKLTFYLTKLRGIVENDLKKQVVFLSHSVKHFDSLRPLIDALRKKGDVDCKIIPIPYYERLADGCLTTMHYEGNAFPKEYKIIDYQTYDFAKELPDCIVINSPYDEFNPVWTVDPFFYSKGMKKYTNKLLYIPWFVTDEINPDSEEDQKAFLNMKYYVSVPGIFHADLTIVQSEDMKQTYLAKIGEFTDEEVKKIMSKKISGAGSCLFGDKEGQGVKEVVKEFRHFLNKV